MRQAIWLPPGFVLGTLAELERAAEPQASAASGRSSPPLLGYPIYQLEPPAQEVDEAGLRGGAADGLAQGYGLGLGSGSGLGSELGSGSGSGLGLGSG